MKNYRVQDACANCAYYVYSVNESVEYYCGHPECTEADTHIQPNGLCDLYEKEDA